MEFGTFFARCFMVLIILYLYACMINVQELIMVGYSLLFYAYGFWYPLYHIVNILVIC
ncbi:hypothetical protein JHK82_056298 [Glycine max]|uniref:Uncharacterized protein n=2 Tax=Glycine subgen. Soja TaxID=1462606 RepID=A0A0R0EBC4_SOYBN|nr:hypothetical protein JHK86_056128 [Glycine max]KAG4910270.1 hypothetical protein JHK87_056386 [Glycine soja]KAG4918871.1 hypothetical protein JHK85_057152 [Glycine max]KAG5077603.1 hypothetical protein JHK82_056298 [Glycine max]KAH1035904.1 hypothetical protein GYH30_055726 [Glycine max]